jgi:thiosulfate/3-mercaptopyruvate sulfurtransferase
MTQSTDYSAQVQWVTTEWLQDHLLDKEVTILDCQPDIHDYIKAHIEGAVYVPEKAQRSSWNGLPGEWIAAEAAQSIFRRAGIEAGMPVVVYTGTGLVKGWGDGLEQTMMAYSLARFGHDRVLLLDGGLNQWLKEGRRTSQVFPAPRGSNFKATIRSDMFVRYEEFKRIKDDQNVIVLDARPANVYAGEGPWIRNGHIPGAVNLPWRLLMGADNPALLRPLGEIEQMVAAKGVTKDKQVICSCGTGREATNEYLLFRCCLDYSMVKLYEGSFTEWSQYPENPIVTGPHPR